MDATTATPRTIQESTPSQRYHSFDSLRATMMLLGLVLHSAMNYVTFPSDWPYKDPHPSSFFDLLILFIHAFRMPSFFVMAGFFAAFLYETRGPNAFLRNRLRRIGLPLVCGWLLLFPLVVVASYAVSQMIGAPEVDPDTLTIGQIFNHLMHLWFLYDLLIFCLAALLIMPLLRHMPQNLCRRIHAACGYLIPRVWGPVLLAAVSGLTLYPMRDWTLDSSDSFLPPARILLAYSVFFTFGWVLYKHRKLIDTFSRPGWGRFFAGLGCFGLYILCIDQALKGAPLTVTHLLATASLALAIWLLIYGFIGLFVRYLEKPVPLGRYLADASYWMYLTHLPITMLLPAFLVDLALPTFVKFSLVLGATTATTLATYHYWVRSTFIGEMLNGRRYPREMPTSPLSVPVRRTS